MNIIERIKAALVRFFKELTCLHRNAVQDDDGIFQCPDCGAAWFDGE